MLPKRYLQAELKAVAQFQTELIKSLQSPHDLVIFGGIGTGKTHLACAYINKLCMSGTYARYVTEYAFADLFTLRHNSEKSMAREAHLNIDHCKNYKVLIIDEVGKRELTKNQLIEIDELVSERYNNELRTIFITNSTKDEFIERLGDRAVDRLRDNGAKMIAVDGKSLRGM